MCDVEPEFPYHFTEAGSLRHRATGEPYAFCFRRDDVQATHQEHRSLCGFVTRHVHGLLDTLLRLQRVPLSRGRAAVYMSPGALQHPGTLLVLIPDLGSMRCGVWSSGCVAAEGLDKGSQIPYVRWAQRESWAVLLMDPNEGFQSPEEHVCHVWDSLVSQAAAEFVMVVAHGYGGVAFVDLLCNREQEVQRRVWAVAFVDSSHSIWHQPLSAEGCEWLAARSRRWVLSDKPLNRLVSTLTAGLQLSAGTLCHEMAPATCMESVLRFFAESVNTNAPDTVPGVVTRRRSLRHRPGAPGRRPK
ncbi:cotranscriptional regulator FAM172A homolog [Denticeps clupeoides]|uniref:cotranscriptional regulator FAM172A homolog n=1 Tax=Denticeps clupeoides TaxID=299321 RepID=UPI003EBB028E